jgi:putative Mg2+ transporter-C (MgtC) family protein
MESVVSEILDAHSLPVSTTVTRMVLAALFGAMVGFEREWRQRPAGLRTHILVCVASATAALLSIEIMEHEAFDDPSVQLDPIRLIEAVTAGVAFLAAGFIVFARGEVHGLTTGAGMWLAAAIGLSTGLGFYIISAVATILGLSVLWLLHLIEDRIVPEKGDVATDKKVIDEESTDK